MALARPVLGHLDPEFLAAARRDERPPAPGVRDGERADPAGQRDRLGGHGGLVRQLRAAGRSGRRRRQRRVRRADVRGGRPARGRGGPGRRPVGRAARPATGSWPPIRRRRSSPWSTPRPRPACATTSSRSAQRQGRRAAPGGHGHLARGDRGRRRRLGRRHRLQRHAEVPGRPARPRAADRLATGPGPARRAALVLVPRPQPARPLRQRRVRRGHVYHHTAPVAMVSALHAGLGALLDEGLEAAWQRHAACGRLLQDGLEKPRPRARRRRATTACPSSPRSGSPTGVDEAAVPPASS